MIGMCPIYLLYYTLTSMRDSSVSDEASFVSISRSERRFEGRRSFNDLPCSNIFMKYNDILLLE